MPDDIDLTEFVELGPRKGPQCSIAQAFEQLNGEADTLRAALAADHIGHANISRWLHRRGLKVSAHTVGHHRRGECSCE